MAYRMPEESRKDVVSLYQQKRLPDYMLSQLILSEENGWVQVELLKDTIGKSSFEQTLAKIDNLDIEEAQDRDYYMWNEYLKEFPQALYDIFEGNYSGEKLSEEEKRYRKVFLDMSYMHLQAAMEDIKQQVKCSYPDKIEWVKKLQL